MVGGVESMSRVQIGLGQNLSDWLRRVFQARSVTQRIAQLRKLRPSNIRLFVPEVKNRVTGRSMGEHTEDMAKTWKSVARSRMIWRYRAIKERSRPRIVASLPI